MPETPLRVLLIAEHASDEFGGEALIPLQYFRILLSRGLDIHLITHARSKPALSKVMPHCQGRLHFVEDSFFDRLMWRIGKLMPDRLANFTLGFASRARTQLKARALARELVASSDIQVIHQPIPVSPREPSFLYGLNTPVVIGPLNGSMEYPPSFRVEVSRIEAAFIALGRTISSAVNLFIPGKRRAAVVLYANERTRTALPKNVDGELAHFPENGVDLDTFRPNLDRNGTNSPFVFIGRLVDWKRVDVLIDAIANDRSLRLTIVGDGPERKNLERRAVRLDVSAQVSFLGWRSQSECSVILGSSAGLVLPSIYESGGAVVLEAMACAVPVIATNWGGPPDYVNASCGILVNPTSREDLIHGFEQAMRRLAKDPDLRRRLGASGRDIVRLKYSWEDKCSQMVEIYEKAIERSAHTSLSRNAERRTQV